MDVKILQIDRTILRELDKDPRIALTQLAQTCNASKERTLYRLERLEDKGVITGYWALPRITSDIGVYKLLVKAKSLGNARPQFLNEVKQHPAASWIAETRGRWDYVISIYGKDYIATTFIEELLESYGKHFAHKTIIKATAATSINERYLHDSYVRVNTDTFGEHEREYDHTDGYIINYLAEHARAKFTDIAREVDKSAATIRKRTKELLDDDTFTDIKLRINHAALGLRYAHLMIGLQDPSRKNDIIAFAKKQEEVVFIMEHLGEYDLHLETVYDEHLRRLQDELGDRYGEALRYVDTIEILDEHRLHLKL